MEARNESNVLVKYLVLLDPKGRMLETLKNKEDFEMSITGVGPP